MDVRGLDGWFDELSGRDGVGYIKLHHLDAGEEVDVGRFEWTDDPEAAEEWLLREAGSIAAGDAAKFRVRAWAPKGLESLASRTFSVHPITETALTELRHMDISGRTLADADAMLAVPGMRAVLMGVTQLVALQGQVIDFQRRVTQDVVGEAIKVTKELRGRLNDSERHLERVLQAQQRERQEQITELTHELADQAAEMERRESALKDKEESPLVVAAERVAKLGKAWVAADKGLSPETVELLANLDPSLAKKLDNPKIRRLLSDPDSGKLLDSLLDSIADDDVIDADDDDDDEP